MRRDRCSSPSTASGATGEPFAHMVANRTMIGALRRARRELPASTSSHRRAWPISKFGPAAIAATTRRRIDDRSAAARRRRRRPIAASRLAGIGTVNWSYGQSGIVVTVAMSARIMAAPTSISCPAVRSPSLPLKGNRSSLVWTERDRHRRAPGRERIALTFGLRTRAALRAPARRDRGARPAAGLSARPDSGPRFRRAALRARRRCRARHPSDRRPGAQSRLHAMSRHSPRRSSRRSGSASTSARARCSNAMPHGGASTRSRWA